MKKQTKVNLIVGLSGALFGLLAMWLLLAPPIQVIVP